MEMPEWVTKAVGLSRDMAAANATDRQFGYHAVVWLADRLTAIEQELASLRMDALQVESQRLGLYEEKDSVGRIEGGASLRRQHEAGAECPQDRIVQPSDLDASHSFSALPCPSEYVNAQTGYDAEDGG